MTKEQFNIKYQNYELFRVYEMFEIYVDRYDDVFHIFKVTNEQKGKKEIIKNYTSEYKTKSLKEAEKYITAYLSII